MLVATTHTIHQTQQFKTEERVYAPVTIDTDGTMYTGDFAANTFAINPDGSLKWKFKARCVVVRLAVSFVHACKVCKILHLVGR